MAPEIPSPVVAPWRPRDSCRRDDVAAGRALRALLGALTPECGDVLAATLGAPAAVEIVGAARGPAPGPVDGWVSVAFRGSTRGRWACVEVERELAVVLAARALRRPAPRVVGLLDDGATASLAGALAAIVSRVGRAAAGGPLLVEAAGSSDAVLAARGASSSPFDCGDVRVVLDGTAFRARLSTEASPGDAPESKWRRELLAGLGEMPLDLRVVAQVAQATAGDLAELGPGDAWMLGISPAARPAWRGVLLAGAGSTRGARAEFVETGDLVLRAGAAEVVEPAMPGEPESDIVEAVGDAPVVVRVEVGAARMSAREWAALSPGDVVTLAHRVADPVTLRVGGVAVAKGELVDVEGELGVRILRRIVSEHAT